MRGVVEGRAGLYFLRVVGKRTDKRPTDRLEFRTNEPRVRLGSSARAERLCIPWDNGSSVGRRDSPRGSSVAGRVRVRAQLREDKNPSFELCPSRTVRAKLLILRCRK